MIPVARPAAANLPRPPLQACISHWPQITHSSRTHALRPLMAPFKIVRAFRLPLGLCPLTIPTFSLVLAMAHPSLTTALHTGAALLTVQHGGMVLLPVQTPAMLPLPMARKGLSSNSNNKGNRKDKREIHLPQRRQVSRS